MTALADSAADPRKGSPSVLLSGIMWLAVALLPITGLAGIGAFGELKGSASVYVFVLVIVTSLATASSRILIPRPLFVFLNCLLVWLAVTTAVNFPEIATSMFHGRSGLNKLATSSAVVIFGMAITISCLGLLRRVSDVENLFVHPLVVAVVACAIFALPEVWSWFSPAGELIYRFSTGLFHTADDEQGRVVGRLISLAFEAPDLSYFCGFACPWMLFAYRLHTIDQPSLARRLAAGIPLAFGIIALLLSNSRTGLLMLGGLIFAELIYWIGLRALHLGMVALLAIVPAVAATGLVPVLALGNVAKAVNDGDVSTISRLALFSAQLSIFKANPVFGVGFGQFGFHAGSVLPSWAWDSYEVVRWFETVGDLPPTFNVPGRLAAELGLPGLMIWFGFWLWAIVRITRSAGQLPRRSTVNYLNAALFGSIISLLAGGTSNDAFRRPETWILIAIVSLHAGRTEKVP